MFLLPPHAKRISAQGAGPNEPHLQASHRGKTAECRKSVVMKKHVLKKSQKGLTVILEFEE